MKKNVLFLFAFFLGTILLQNLHAQTCPGANRQLFNAKAETQYDAIGASLKNFLSDNTNAAWLWESGATFVENSDGTARLRGVLKSFQYPATHRLDVDITFTGRTFTAPAGSPVLMNTNPSTNGWYYYEWGTATMTGLNNLAGAKVNLAKRGKSLQVGVGAADQVQDVAKLGASGWFTWAIVSQPTNPAVRINAFPNVPSIDQADLVFTLSGTPTVCGNDPCANVATPTFNNCPTSQLEFTAGANGCATISYSLPTATGGTVAVQSGPASGSCQNPGTYTVVFVATSATCGKTATCSLTIKVNAANDPCANVATPTFNNCPTSQLEFTAGANGCATINYSMPTATGGTVAVQSGPASGSCQNPGTYTVVFVATSATCGKTATCSLTIKVNAANDPCANVATPTFSNCPTSQLEFTAGANGCATINYSMPTATGGTVAVQSGPASGSCQNPGTYTVVFVATSATCGKTATCSLTIKVNPATNPCTDDKTPPVITGCPANISKTINTECERIFWTAPTATDNCSTPTLTFKTAPIEGRGIGSCYTAGETTVTYTATDAKGNTSTCSFKIIITTTCNPITDPGQIAGDQELCRGAQLTPITNVRSASGGSGAIEYLWMYSDGSSVFDPVSWQVVPNETGAGLSNFPTLTKTTYFIRCVRRAGCLLYQESNVVTKKVNACLQGNALQSFNVTVMNTKKVRLDWITKEEQGDSKFVVERSYDGTNFMEIAQVKSKNQELNMYQFEDVQPKMGRSFYRIKHIENAGSLAYSKVKSTTLYINGGDPIMAYPNPATNNVYVEVLDTEYPEGNIEVYNTFGKLMKTQQFTKDQMRYEVNMSGLPAGTYILKVRQSDGQIKSIKVNKN